MTTTADMADMLVPFCESASISISKDLGAVVKKRIIISLCFADTRALHDSLFPDQHMDWNGVREYTSNMGSCTSKDWLALLALLDFVNEQPSRQMVAEIIASTLAGIKVSTQGKLLSPIESLQLCFAKAGVAPSWDILCKTLVLCNLAEIDHSVVMHEFLVQQPTATVDTIIKALPSCKHTPDEYTQTFYFLLGQCCQVRTHVLNQAFQNRLQKRERIKKHAQSVYHAHKKPSLTLILEINSNTTGQVEEDFATFCNAARLPSNASMQVKRALYYLRMLDAFKGNPDIKALKSFISDIHHTGPPCAALRLFKDRCIPGGLMMHWSTVLRLYLAAYCTPAAKELWRFAVTDTEGPRNSLCGSTETEMTIQRYVTQTPFDIETIADLVPASVDRATPLNIAYHVPYA